MARITIEDSLRVANSVWIGFLGIKTCPSVTKRCRTIGKSKNREIVTALREIAAGKVVYANPEYLKGSKEDFKPIPDSSEFIGDEEYIE